MPVYVGTIIEHACRPIHEIPYFIQSMSIKLDNLHTYIDLHSPTAQTSYVCTTLFVCGTICMRHYIRVEYSYITRKITLFANDTIRCKPVLYLTAKCSFLLLNVVFFTSILVTLPYLRNLSSWSKISCFACLY